MPTDAELLADLLDGELDVADVPDDLAGLFELAGAVRQHVVPVPPTPAFREALREELVQAGGPAGPGGDALGGASGGGGGAGGLGGGAGGGAAGSIGGAMAAVSSAIPGVVAAVAATAVLATGGVAAAAGAVPGDLLYGLKRQVESTQLLIASDARDVDLLAGFAVERISEALGLTDTVLVHGLVDESMGLFDDALALAVAQGREVDDLVARQVGALFTLASRTDDAAVEAQVRQVLLDLGVDLDRDGDLPRFTAPGTGLSTDATRDERDDAGRDSATDSGDATGGGGTMGGDATPGVDDTVDDVTDAVDDAVDDATDAVDDVTDPVQDATDAVTDAVDDAVRDTGGAVGDTVDDLGEAVEGTTTEVGDLLGN